MSDIVFYVMVALIPSMLVLGLLLRRNPFDQKLRLSEADLTGQREPTDFALAMIASILDHPVSNPKAENAPDRPQRGLRRLVNRPNDVASRRKRIGRE
jgi:hypothetical protein